MVRRFTWPNAHPATARGWGGKPTGANACPTDEDIVAVLSFIKSTWPGKTQRRHDDINMRTKKPGN